MIRTALATGCPAALLNSDQAITACSDAAARFPEVPRVRAQLGRAYLKAQEFTDALRWVRATSEEGYAPAQNMLGVMYMNGMGVAPNETEAARWYRAAAEQGYAAAQNNLGWLYRNGIGVALDYVEAARWFELAANQGDLWAQMNLGVMYRNGFGVEQDDALAVEWFGKAAERGHAWAQNNLGTMYLRGIGVPQDLSEAVRWFTRAADGGSQDAGEAARENLELLTPADRVRVAQAMLTEADYDAGPSDGVMGDQTRLAIREFRRDHGLPDGDEVTLDLLLALGRVE